MQKHDFPVFLELWNMTQGHITPSIHYRMAVWLQASWERGDTQLLLMAFRASGKSTLVGLFSAWLLWRDPDLRILVLAAESSLATKMVRNIRKIIEKHPLTRHLIPNKADQWASDRFSIQRQRELRDPSVLAAGVTTNITGCRADVIIYDDVEVPNTSDTATKREALRERLNESNFILVPGGTQLYIGTPHTYFSIYADGPREEIGESESFLADFKKLKIPIFDKEGKSVWPSRYGDDDIRLLQRQSGPHKFASQMLLQPVNITEGRLNITLLKFYDDDLVYTEANRQTNLSLGDSKLVSCSAWWDPAFGSAKGDHSVFALVFTDEEGNHYLHHLEYIRVRCDQGEDEATKQCQKICEIAAQFYVPSIAVETNGIGKFLPAILKRELARQNIACAVIEKSSNKPKHVRILESFDAVMAARSFYVHEAVKQTPFITEMSEWQPMQNSGHDDGLDAVAGALSLEPVRIKRSYTNAKPFWQKSGRHFTAETNFDV